MQKLKERIKFFSQNLILTDTTKKCKLRIIQKSVDFDRK